ncbi:hypothetical protein ACFLZP_03850 [Patescibacteria group bacterium]
MVKKVVRVLLFGIVLGIFVFSLYKIVIIKGIWPGQAKGLECPVGNVCDLLDGFCDSSCSQCLPTETPIKVLPTPTPTLTCTPTQKAPTPTLTPTESEPTLTPTPTDRNPTPISEEPTLTPKSAGVGGNEEKSNLAVAAPGCDCETPDPPTLLRAEPISSVELEWTKIDKATHYSIVYGPQSDHYLYGVADTGLVTDFVVRDLDSKETYCFAVRAHNDCAPSQLSNEICTLGSTSSQRGQVLGLASTGKGKRSPLALYCFILACLSFSGGFSFLPRRKTMDY